MGDIRPTVNYLGEYYGDRLALEAWLLKTSIGNRATSLLKNGLNSRRAATDEKLAYLARKRGLNFEQFVDSILLGSAEHLTDEEYATLKKLED